VGAAHTPEFEKRWNRYRAVDKASKTVEFYLSRTRDVNAAKAFLRRAIKSQRMPTKITLDAYAASHRAVAECQRQVEMSGFGVGFEGCGLECG
jgi:transposase-like protein